MRNSRKKKEAPQDLQEERIKQRLQYENNVKMCKRTHMNLSASNTVF